MQYVILCQGSSERFYSEMQELLARRVNIGVKLEYYLYCLISLLVFLSFFIAFNIILQLDDNIDRIYR